MAEPSPTSPNNYTTSSATTHNDDEPTVDAATAIAPEAATRTTRDSTSGMDMQSAIPSNAGSPANARVVFSIAQKRLAETPSKDQGLKKKAKIDKSAELLNGILGEMGTDMVDLYVGEKEKLFRVHKKKLCDSIPYFDKMFNTGFEESIDNRAYFPDDTAICFGILIFWLYRDKLPPFSKLYDDVRRKWIYHPLDLYCFADKLLLPKLKEDAINLYWLGCNTTETLPTMEYILKIYAMTSDGSSFRKFGARALYHLMHTDLNRHAVWTTKSIYKAMSESEDLGMDILKLMRNKVAVVTPRNLPRCVFHEHGKDVGCARKVVGVMKKSSDGRDSSSEDDD